MSKRHLTRLSEKLSFRIDLGELDMIKWHDGSIDVFFNGTSFTVSGHEAEILNNTIEVPDHSFFKLSEQLAVNVSKIQIIEWQHEPLSAKIHFCDATTTTLDKEEARQLKKLIGHNFDGDPEASLGQVLHGG